MGFRVSKSKTLILTRSQAHVDKQIPLTIFLLRHDAIGRANEPRVRRQHVYLLQGKVGLEEGALRTSRAISPPSRGPVGGLSHLAERMQW